MLPSEALFDAAQIEAVMHKILGFLELRIDGTSTSDEVLFQASTASKSGKPHENGRDYVSGVPPGLEASLRAWFCKPNLRLAALLQSNRMIASTAEIPWLNSSCAAD